jgi:hypothetical protein
VRHAATATSYSSNLLNTKLTTGGQTKAVFYLFNKHLRDSGVPGEALKRKIKKDISFALRRGTIAQVTTLALDAAQRAAEAELNRQRGGSGMVKACKEPLSYCVGITEYTLPLLC